MVLVGSGGGGGGWWWLVVVGDDFWLKMKLDEFVTNGNDGPTTGGVEHVFLSRF